MPERLPVRLQTPVDTKCRVPFQPDIACAECGKRFTSFNNLNSHARVHTGIRKYKCSTCYKDFAYLNVLKNHERAHAGIKKYVCHECGAKFVQPANLKVPSLNLFYIKFIFQVVNSNIYCTDLSISP